MIDGLRDGRFRGPSWSVVWNLARPHSVGQRLNVDEWGR